MLLAFEKEVLGIYVSGHPLEEYEGLWKRMISAKTTDFLLDDETGNIRAIDGEKVVVGGIISSKKIKYTKNDKIMAFITLEDLVGSVEVIVFPKNYESNANKLVEDEKVFVTGRVQADDERDGKVICENITTFDEIPKKLWVQFETRKQYGEQEAKLLELIKDSDGKDSVNIFIKELKSMKVLPTNRNVKADNSLIDKLVKHFGEENIKIV